MQQHPGSWKKAHIHTHTTSKQENSISNGHNIGYILNIPCEFLTNIETFNAESIGRREKKNRINLPLEMYGFFSFINSTNEITYKCFSKNINILSYIPFKMTDEFHRFSLSFFNEPRMHWSMHTFIVLY